LPFFETVLSVQLVQAHAGDQRTLSLEHVHATETIWW